MANIRKVLDGKGKYESAYETGKEIAKFDMGKQYKKYQEADKAAKKEGRGMAKRKALQDRIKKTKGYGEN